MKLLKAIINWICPAELPPGWYFVALDNKPLLECAFWSGAEWVRQKQVIETKRITSIRCSITTGGNYAPAI